jgi:hypothetical protein
MNDFDPSLIHMLRAMAGDHCSVAEMARAILPKMSSGGGNAIEVLRYFREAFCLTLAQAKPVADWIVYNRTESSDSELHKLVWPCIESLRAFWEHQQPV